MNKNDIINVEEDGDEIFTPFPKYCIKCFDEKYKLIVNEKGFVCCPNCGGSYGRKS